MDYSVEQVNAVLQRIDVAQFLEERERDCRTCRRPVKPVGDGHFLILLHAAIEDPEAKRGSSMAAKSRACQHVEEHFDCYGCGGIRKRIGQQKYPEQERLGRFVALMSTGEITNVNGRWTFEPYSK